ncbi:hypothetical protein GCM10009674_07920 [Nesterenkonia xinjiangensis]
MVTVSVATAWVGSLGLWSVGVGLVWAALEAALEAAPSGASRASAAAVASVLRRLVRDRAPRDLGGRTGVVDMLISLSE